MDNKEKPKEDFNSIYDTLIELIKEEYSKVAPEIQKEQQKEQGFNAQKFVRLLFLIIFLFNAASYIFGGGGRE